jgi:hypothetical protein
MPATAVHTALPSIASSALCLVCMKFAMLEALASMNFAWLAASFPASDSQ